MRSSWKWETIPLLTPHSQRLPFATKVTDIISCQASRAGKMNQILRRDCLPERPRWSHTARSELPALFLQKHECQFLTNRTRNLNQLQFAMFLSPSDTLMSNSSSAWCCSSDWFSGGLLRNETSIIFKGRTNQFLLWHQLHVKGQFPAIGFVSCPASLSQKFLSFPAFIKQLYQDVWGWGISYYNLHIWE